jgi:hypothetical protein
MTDELRGQIARMLGGGVAGEAPKSVPAPAPQEIVSPPKGSSELAEAAPAMPAPPVATPGDERVDKAGDQPGSAALPHRNKAAAATQSGPEGGDDYPSSAKRLHGGALPK